MIPVCPIIAYRHIGPLVAVIPIVPLALFIIAEFFFERDYNGEISGWSIITFMIFSLMSAMVSGLYLDFGAP